jgi:photosystem II stability/assembly factor-like uncharacterized protein
MVRVASSTLRGVAASEDTFVGVGDRGAIVAATGQEGSWRSIVTGETASLNAVTASGGRFIAVGDGGTILVSLDDGRHWRRSRAPGHEALRAVTAEGERILAVGNRGTLLHSEDGGQRWFAQQVPTTARLAAVSLHGDEILIGGNEVLLHSHNLGRTWYFETKRAPTLFAIARSARDEVLAAGIRYLARRPTRNPLEWQISTDLAATLDFFGLSIGPDQRSFAVGDGGALFVSDDGGDHWSDRTRLLEGTRTNFERAWASSAGDIYVVGDGGSILAFNATQRRWRRSRPTTTDLYAVWGSPEGSVFVGGLGGSVLRSKDGGLSWQKLQGVEQHISGLWGSPREMIAVDKAIVRSTDGGETWNSVARPPEGLTEVWGRENGEYFAVGPRGAILHSTDGGLHWLRMESGVSVDLQTVRGDLHRVWATGDHGVILRLSAGRRWNVIKTGTTAAILGVTPVSNHEVIVCTSAGEVLRSSDDGRTWRPDETTTNRLTEVISSQGRSWAFGEWGTILLHED